ncbi:Zinc finger protein 622 [Colletotrichum chlorophyti]|uniref:Zinc finger protein 622 n=1 Tax=Colletotrichum chlorophyti TaxID=708187 RepID=A0A1Q8RUG3_9PEZI|nr:Zinc finger protein 622 [Colletotrichum chlorophyti]
MVIFEYAECLFCGSMRNTPQAAQQHMIGEGHCRIDIRKEASEFKDFYDFGPNSDTDDEGQVRVKESDRFVDLDDKTRRLASGKILSHRSAQRPQVHRSLHEKNSTAGRDSLSEGGSSTGLGSSTALTLSGSKKGALTSTEKRDAVFKKQLATLRAEDRQALMHLPLPQQRALVATAKQQRERWNRERTAHEIKWQLKSNQ